MALDDARGRLYVTCQGSGTVDVLDTAALATGVQAEAAVVQLPLPFDVTVPTLDLPSSVGDASGAKVCAAFTSTPGVVLHERRELRRDARRWSRGCRWRAAATNNPVGLHNGPRGIALAPDGNTLWVVNQFTTSIATLDVSPSAASADLGRRHDARSPARSAATRHSATAGSDRSSSSPT